MSLVSSLRLLALITLVIALGGCASRPRLPDDHTIEGLRRKQSGVVLISLHAGGRDIFGRSICGAGMTVAPINAADKRGIGLSGKGLDDAHFSTTLFTHELPAGTYGIVSYSCFFSNSKTVVNAPAGQPFAVFTVNPGEVVDVGQITVAVQQHGGVPLLFSTGHSAVSFVDPLGPSAVAAVKPEYRDRIVRRQMIPNPILSRKQLEAVCEHEKSRQVLSKAPTYTCRRLETVAGPNPQVGNTPWPPPPPPEPKVRAKVPEVAP